MYTLFCLRLPIQGTYMSFLRLVAAIVVAILFVNVAFAALYIMLLGAAMVMSAF